MGMCVSFSVWTHESFEFAIVDSKLPKSKSSFKNVLGNFSARSKMMN